MSKNKQGKDLLRRWVVPLQDADDGSGDGIVDLPQEIIDELGLKVGDTLIYTVVKDRGVVMLKKKKDTCDGFER